MAKIKAVIEIPKWASHKYELDTSTGLLHLDRVLPLPLPENYGFIPNTLCDDGDPLDVFVLSIGAIAPLVSVNIEPFAVIWGIDNGESDPKILATITGDDYKKKYKVKDTDIVRFLEQYKKGFEIEAFGNTKAALKLIKAARKAYCG